MEKINIATANKLKRTIREILDKLIEYRVDRISESELNDREVVDCNVNGAQAKREIYYFFSKGCDWAFDGGPCLMCGHYRATKGGSKVKSENLVKQFNTPFKTITKDIKIICLYNAGSFLNNEEIPQKAFKKILIRIGKSNEIEKVILESLPQYITPDLLTAMRDHLGNKKIEIGIGFDSTNEFVRKYCINKGADIIEQFNTINLLKKTNITPLCYILLKPPFLSEKEAIEDTVNSIEELHSKGFVVFSIEPVSIQTGSFVQYLYKKKQYKPPSFWALQEVIRRIKDMPIEVRIGGWQYRPSPYYSLKDYRCEYGCHVHFEKGIKNINIGKGYETLLNIKCTCKKEWERKIESEEDNVEKIKNFLKSEGK
jgi:hypothetical protein